MDTYIVKYKQNIYDVALQLYGDVSGIANILSLNDSINLSTSLILGSSVIYDKTEVLNADIVGYFSDNNIVVSNGEGNVYFKDSDAYGSIKSAFFVNKDSTNINFTLSGVGEIGVDWGDNSEIQLIALSNEEVIFNHSFDSYVSSYESNRKIRFYGDFIIDTLKSKKSMIEKVFVFESTTINSIDISLNNIDNVGFFNISSEASNIIMTGVRADSLIPLINQDNMRDLWINESTLSQDALDNYFIGLVKDYRDRPSCTVRMWGNNSPSGIYQKPDVLYDPQTGLEAMWVLENERGWTINEIISAPLENTIARRFRSRDGCELIDELSDTPIDYSVSSFFNGIDSYTIFPSFNFLEGNFIELDIDLSKASENQYIFGSTTEPEVGMFVSDTLHSSGSIERIRIERTSQSEFTIYNEDGYLGVITNDDWQSDFVINIIGKRGDDSLFFKGAMKNVNFNDDIFIPYPHLHYCSTHYSDYSLITQHNVSIIHDNDTSYGSIALPVSKFSSERSSNVVTVVNASTVNDMSIKVFLEYLSDEKSTLIGAKDNVSGSTVEINLNVNGTIEFRHGTSVIESNSSIFDYKVHTLSIDGRDIAGTKCYIDGVIVGDLGEQQLSTDSLLSIGCLRDSDSNNTNFSNAMIWDVSMGGNSYFIPLPNLGYEVVTGALGEVNNVSQIMLDCMYGGVKNIGGCEWMQINGAVARRPNLLLNGYDEKIGYGDTFEVWSETITDASEYNGKSATIKALLKIDNDAYSDGTVRAYIKVEMLSSINEVLSYVSTNSQDVSYSNYEETFIIPSETDHIKVGLYHYPETSSIGNVYAKEISLKIVEPEWIPNNSDGKAILPLLSSDSFIGGSSFLNQTPFDLNFNGGDEKMNEYLWDKTREDVWKNSVRESECYSTYKPKKWCMQELTQRFIVDNIYPSFLYIPWIKIDSGKIIDIFQYPTQLTGDDKNRCDRYVHLTT